MVFDIFETTSKMKVLKPQDLRRGNNFNIPL